VTLASIVIGGVQFDEPLWLYVFPILAIVFIWLARQSLSGLGTRARQLALVARLLALALLLGALARPQWREEAKHVALTAILDSSRSVPQARQKAAEEYIAQSRAADKDESDALGVISVGETAVVQALPLPLNRVVERNNIGNDLATDLAAGVRLAMAVRPENAAYRLLLITDGNETSGSLLQAAEAAKAAHIPIDILPVRYQSDAEVTVDQLVAPTTARMGESLNLRVVLTSTKPAKGRLNLLLNDEPVDLDPDSPATGQVVSLAPGSNVLTIPLTIPRAGPQRFRAVFEPMADASGKTGDTILENNEALAVTFVSGQGKVLVIAKAETQPALEPLLNVFREAKIAAEVSSADRAPQSLTELNAYDAIVLADESGYDFSQQAQEDLRQYVHDSGGGLVMIGGPDSFGAGGWIGSPLEDALPVRMDPPQKRQMPRGALMLITHSVEMPSGVSWGKKTATAAIDALSRLDLAGIVEYQGGSSATLVHPLSEIGDGSAIKRSINRLVFGDMFDYSAAFTVAIAALQNADAGAKHIILISDGDAQPPTTQQIQTMKKSKITVSTVGVFPHSKGDLGNLKSIAEGTGGNHYEVTDDNGLGHIVQIFIKEAQTVKRALIWEGTPFSPAFVGAAAENLRGFGSFPPLSGYIVTGEREGLAMVTLRGKENDPIAAQWQYGLGRSLAFTSDATSRWNSQWIAWPGFRAFWEQSLRWVMRPTGNANMRVTTERDGDTTKVVVEATDQSGERLNFARFKGRLAGPNGAAQDIDLQQVGPGRYEGRVETKASGSYVASLRYAAPDPQGKGLMEGTVQAAITKPFADEFRAMSDNLPLLQQVAAMTGGNVLEGDIDKDRLWRRDGLTMPVALTPIWMVFACAGIGVFLIDVGVRRVRIDLEAIRRAFLSRSERAKAGQQIGALKSAREAARRAIEQRSQARGSGETYTPSPDTAKVKFEATPEQLKRASEAAIAGAEGPGAPSPSKQDPKKPDSKPAEEGGLSRLKQAKRRARDDMQE
jgi:uncharacterized membrane protein/Mg-chelatase subunit ChlD